MTEKRTVFDRILRTPTSGRRRATWRLAGGRKGKKTKLNDGRETRSAGRASGYHTISLAGIASDLEREAAAGASCDQPFSFFSVVPRAFLSSIAS